MVLARLLPRLPALLSSSRSLLLSSSAPSSSSYSSSYSSSSRTLEGLGKGFDLLSNTGTYGRAQISIDGYVPNEGFMATDHNQSSAEMDLYGSVIATPNDIFLWRAGGNDHTHSHTSSSVTDYDISSNSYDADFYKPLELILRMQPAPPDNVSLVVIGVPANRMAASSTGHVPTRFLDTVKVNAPETNVEIMEISGAIATFNILVGEGRNVVAALLV